MIVLMSVVSSAKDMKNTNKKIISRTSCLHCGEKIPLLKHFSISIYKGVECPKCHSYMTFSKKYFAFQIFLFLMLFPILALFERNKLFGFLGLLGIVFISFLVSYRAKYNRRVSPKKESTEQ